MTRRFQIPSILRLQLPRFFCANTLEAEFLIVGGNEPECAAAV
jgi:hypothetical protein